MTGALATDLYELNMAAAICGLGWWGRRRSACLSATFRPAGRS